MELYVHIPFCVKKCNYCDFLSFSCSKETKDAYVLALLQEIKAAGKEYQGQKIDTIYFGGGTPSVLQTEQLIAILDQLIQSFSIKTEEVKRELKKLSDCSVLERRLLHEDGSELEITIEVNPATIDYIGLHKLKQSGFNRISIGLQSTKDEELKLLGRIYTYGQFLEVYQDAWRAGFHNINVDLISALPGQSLEMYLESLHNVISLAPKPTHISSYSLIIEEGTPFYDVYFGHEELLPDEELDRAMYAKTKEVLKEAGYERYEISNYALRQPDGPLLLSKHNSGYWSGIPYLGLGLGASSYVEHKRWKNTDSMEEYLQWNNQGMELKKYDLECLSKEDEMEEYMFLGLRMSRGVSISKFKELFAKDFFLVYGKVIEKLKEEGLVKFTGDDIMLTDKGMDVSNYVFEQFLL